MASKLRAKWRSPQRNCSHDFHFSKISIFCRGKDRKKTLQHVALADAWLVSCQQNGMLIIDCGYRMCPRVIIYNGQQQKAVTMLACSNGQCKILIERHFLGFDFKCPGVKRESSFPEDEQQMTEVSACSREAPKQGKPADT